MGPRTPQTLSGGPQHNAADFRAMITLHGLARALRSETVGRKVLGPGPGHPLEDRGASIRLSPTAPGGSVAFSRAGDSWQSCRDHIKAWVGVSRDNVARRSSEAHRRRAEARPVDDGREKKFADALSLWAVGVDPRGDAGRDLLEISRFGTRRRYAP
jgi:putative DNA primase/helicase